MLDIWNSLEALGQPEERDTGLRLIGSSLVISASSEVCNTSACSSILRSTPMETCSYSSETIFSLQVASSGATCVPSGTIEVAGTPSRIAQIEGKPQLDRIDSRGHMS
jgi:hypothetical protein